MAKSSGQSMVSVRLIGIVIAAAVLLTIVLQNTRTTGFRILMVYVEMPLAVLVFLSAALGFFIGVVMMLFRRKR